jgi:methylated-DNA-[protein]-cysteine S-methyltransferase
MTNISVLFSVEDDLITSTSMQMTAKKGLTFEINDHHSSSNVRNLITQWMKAYTQGRNPKVLLPLQWQDLPPYTTLVLTALQSIPFNSLVTYKELAMKTGKPKAARAVGNACASNPFPLIIPCHRVIASDGSLGGFSCGLPIKKALLEFESSFK